METEIRSLRGELRAAPGFKLEGIAARYGSRSSNLGGFVEQIAPGAFSRSLKAGSKVVVTKNHDPNYVLGKHPGTATVFDSPEGLRFSVQLDKANTMHADTYASVKRGDLDSCSFAFRVLPVGGDSWADGAVDDKGNSCQLRTLLDVDLIDCAVVCYPAYPQGTQVDARSLTERGLLRVAPRKARRTAPFTWEELARAQGTTVAKLRAASASAHDAALRGKAHRLARQMEAQTDAELKTRAARLLRAIEDDNEQFIRDEALRERMENAAGRTCRTTSRANKQLYPYEQAGSGSPDRYPYEELASAISKSFPDHKLVGADSKTAYTRTGAGMKYSIPYSQDADGSHSFGKPALGGHPVWLKDGDVS